VRAWLETTLGRLLPTEVPTHWGVWRPLRGRSGFESQHTAQLRAWEAELLVLGEASSDVVRSHSETAAWPVFLEVEIPRRQKRIDAVVLAGNAVVVIEFKVGASTFDRAGLWQVEDYALDLRDFHETSHARRLVPVLVATEAGDEMQPEWSFELRGPAVEPVRCVGAAGLGKLLRALARARCPQHIGDALRVSEWIGGGYRPAMGIIEAAERLFANHSVREISHAYADNLEETCDALVEAIVRPADKGDCVLRDRGSCSVRCHGLSGS
jgi:hypothetical protein